MTKSFKILLTVMLFAVITSCSAIRNEVDRQARVNTSVLSIGMTKDEVSKAMHKKPYNTVRAERDPQTNAFIEVVEYAEFDNNDHPVESYWLYFNDGKLDRWELVRPRRRSAN